MQLLGKKRHSEMKKDAIAYRCEVERGDEEGNP